MISLHLSVAALTLAALAQAAAPSSSTSVTVLPFVLAGDAAASEPARSACPAGVSATLSGVTPSQQTAILASIQQEIQTRLAAHPLPPSETPLLLTGCVTRMEAGSKAKRVVGLTMGASYLAANVRLLSHTASADTPIRTFAVEIKGDNPAPPVFGGAIYNAVHNKKVSIEADAIKLADQIADRAAQPESPAAKPPVS